MGMSYASSAEFYYKLPRRGGSVMICGVWKSYTLPGEGGIAGVTDE
jgi:hypothetical protein